LLSNFLIFVCINLEKSYTQTKWKASDLSGFGVFAKQHIKNLDEKGIEVIRRRTKTFDESAEDLSEKMLEFVHFNRRERIELRNRAEALSESFSWESLAKYYLEAYELAVG
ncbi:MAG TPA: hypothetical protein ENK85_09835, partial [Saprospiraceae bacterium]|nr:hypothetical protein [Saprospiraceae bacterium]